MASKLLTVAVALFGLAVAEDYPLHYGNGLGDGGADYGHGHGHGHGHEHGGYGPDVHYQPSVAKVPVHGTVEKHVDYYVS